MLIPTATRQQQQLTHRPSSPTYLSRRQAQSTNNSPSFAVAAIICSDNIAADPNTTMADVFAGVVRAARHISPMCTCVTLHLALTLSLHFLPRTSPACTPHSCIFVAVWRVLLRVLARACR